MRYLKAVLLLVLLPSLASAQSAVLGPAANPSQPVTVLLNSAIPFIKAPSGTMGDNGAISGMTALPKIYSSGAYIYLPAGAIAAGVPSTLTWYWFVASSTTAGTVYNNTYTSGTPTAPVSPTPFVTTGPGAFTGRVGTDTAISITVPGNMLGRSGALRSRMAVTYNTTAGVKKVPLRYGPGATVAYDQNLTTAGYTIVNSSIANRGLATAQSLSYTSLTAAASSMYVDPTVGAVNTTAAFTWIIQANTAVATDYIIIEECSLEVTKDVTQ